jgi:hypothetical protein
MLASYQRTGALDGGLAQILDNQHQDVLANALVIVSVAPAPHAAGDGQAARCKGETLAHEGAREER